MTAETYNISIMDALSAFVTFLRNAVKKCFAPVHK